MKSSAKAKSTKRNQLFEVMWRQCGYIRNYLNVLSCRRGNKFDTEDVLQETLAAAWQNANQFSGDSGAIRGWLKIIAKRKYIDSLRAKTAKKRSAKSGQRIPVRTTERPSGFAVNLAAASRTPSSQVASFEARDAVLQCLDQISARHAQAIRLRYFEARSLVEVGEHFGLNDQAASMLIKRALIQLRKQMGGDARYFD